MRLEKMRLNMEREAKEAEVLERRRKESVGSFAFSIETS
jgi:hypothetical protein